MRCPVCRAENAQGPHCRRCKADLAMLFAIEAEREHGLARAVHCLRDGQPRQAQMILTQLRTLRDGEDLRRLQSLAALLAGDFRRAWRLYPPGPSNPRTGSLAAHAQVSNP